MKKRILLPVILVCLLIFGYNRVPVLNSAGSSVKDILSRSVPVTGTETLEERRTDNIVIDESEGEFTDYYYGLLSAAEQKAYRQMLFGINSRQEEFYISLTDNESAQHTYHALLNDHPELFWVHNREQVYTTTYAGTGYCKFSPGYTYTDEEVAAVQQAMESAWQSVSASITSETDTYEKVRVVYDYLVDHVEYAASDHDQNIAGVFWKGQAVCAGYARAMQYLLGKLDIPCIYVEGDSVFDDEGHAWNIVQINADYYYVDVTNADQPQFLEGDAAQLAEHKTIMYDYLCPFPSEYEQMYTVSDEFEVPTCTSDSLNFYILNQGCFDAYDYNSIYNYCCMRLNNGAAVVRFKFSGQTAFETCRSEWIDGGYISDVAQYYMSLYGMSNVEYHYGILENLKTIYFIF